MIKFNLVCFAALICLLLTPRIEAQEDNFPVSTEFYFGQKPPGDTPELFSPGVVSRDNYFEHSSAVFSPDLREVYWSAKADGKRYFDMFVSQFKNDRWTEPRIVSFLDTNYSSMGPAISPDGEELYFDKDNDIWVVKRQGGGWSEPERVSDISIPGRSEWIGSVTQDGSIYFKVTTISPRVDRIYVARRSADGFSAPSELGVNFQSGYVGIGGVYVAPDESYMILELQLDKRSSGLFVSYSIGENSWTPLVNLPLGFGRFPGVSPDGRYIFYVTHSGIHWVSANILERLRPDQSE